MSNRSTGPRSDQGKARSSQNATKHGILSDRDVTPDEDAAEWAAFRDDVVADWRPATRQEHELAVRIAKQYWRLRRVDRFETQSITDAMNLAGRHTAYTLTGVYATEEGQACKRAWRAGQDYEDELALVPRAQEALGCLHNAAADTPIDPDAGRLLRGLFGDDVEPQPLSAADLRRELSALTRRPLAQALRLAAAKLEERRRQLEEDVAAAQRKFEFAANETALAGTALRNERALPLDEALKRVQRYEAHVSRQLEKAVALLEKVQAARRARDEAAVSDEEKKAEQMALLEKLLQHRAQARPAEETSFRNSAPRPRCERTEAADAVDVPGSEEGGSFRNSPGEAAAAEDAAEFVQYFAGGRHNGNGAGAERMERG